MASDANSRFGLCIVGCGDFARVHADAARRRDDIDLFFASRTLAKAIAYQSEFAGAGAFGSYEDAANAPRVDGLVFCTPHSLHRENLELGAAHGKPVLMEKPIATTIADARAMISIAADADIPFMVAENFRYMGVVRTAQELLRDGAIGRILSVHGQEAVYRRPLAWRLSKEMMGGGALIDGGIHKLNVLRLLLGEPLTVSAFAHPKSFPEMQGEDGMSLIATFGDSVVATLVYSWAALGNDGPQTFLATGVEGTMAFEFYGTAVTVRSPCGERTVTAVPDRRGIDSMLADFIKMARTGRPAAMPPEEGLGDLTFVLAAYDSAAQGGRVVTL